MTILIDCKLAMLPKLHSSSVDLTLLKLGIAQETEASESSTGSPYDIRPDSPTTINLSVRTEDGKTSQSLNGEADSEKIRSYHTSTQNERNDGISVVATHPVPTRLPLALD